MTEPGDQSVPRDAANAGQDNTAAGSGSAAAQSGDGVSKTGTSSNSGRTNKPANKATVASRPLAVKKKKRPKKRRIRWPEARTDVPSVQPLLEPPKKSLRERIENAGPGFATSLVLHTVIFLVMAWYTFFNISRAGFGSIDGAWIVDTKRDSVTNAPPINIRAIQPPKVASVGSAPDRSNTKPVGGGGTPEKQRAPRPPVSPVDVSQLLDDRNPTAAKQRLFDDGGNEATWKCIQTALAWFQRQQQSAGNWQLHAGYPDAGERVLRTDTGATALAMLCLIGAGNTHEQGDFQSTVARGRNWLVGVQKPSGDFHDHVELGRQTAFYAHTQATIALAELFALSGDESLRPPVERAVRFLLQAQQPMTGGWKYRPLTADSVADLSVTGWALMALHTARAAGIEVPDEAFFRATQFLDSVEEDNGAAYRYEPSDPPDRVSTAMTAEGLLCRQYLGWTAEQPALQRGRKLLLGARAEPAWVEGRRNVYEWYYAAHVLHNLADEDWQPWFGHVQQIIVSQQTRSGSSRKGKDVRGSWHPLRPTGSPHEYAQKAGRLYLTAMCVLILETPFRYRALDHPNPSGPE